MPSSGLPSGASPPPVAVPKQAFSLTLSSGAVFAASLLVQVLGLIGSIVLIKQTNGAQHLALVSVVGTVQLFLLIGSSINGVGDLRLGTAYTYFLARGRPATDTTTTYFVVRVAMVGAAGLALFVIAPLSLGGQQLVSGNQEVLAFGLFMALPLLWSFSTVYNSMFIGEGNSLKAQYPSLVESLARLPFLFYVAYHDFSILGITLAYVAGAAASALFSLPAVYQRMRRFRRAEAVRMFRYAWPLMASLLINYIVTNAVPLIVGIGLGTKLLSVFLAANGFRILILSLPAAIATPLFPYLAGLHRQEKYEAIRQGTWQALRYSAMLLVPGVVALVTYRYNFLNVFYTSYYASQGAFAMALLSVGALPLALSQVMQSSINAIGRQRLELYITSTQVIVLFGAVALFVPPWGVLPIHPGVVAGAVAILASSTAALVLNTYFMESLIRVHIHLGSIGAITVSAAGSFASLWVINHNIHPGSSGAIAAGVGDRFATLWLALHSSSPVSTWYELLTVVAIGFVAYFVILALIGELTRADVRRIGHSLALPTDFVETLANIAWKESPPDLAPVDLALAPGLRS
ncbi:MAG TPA: oligosaccharide flippase family protein, partial [Thermoplasmata archaeon]|nr:oligosaccharide flippase family protein [Thermoplasmata archaeon]